ncbi:MAG: rod shape-determining protein MreB [Acidimicrobiaceae bacterium]|nr:rod shape-determining protein MreB [Acidimicrobiaceae bacterium]
MSTDLALDLGSVTTRVTDRDGVRLDEPTLAAIDGDSGRLLAFGREAEATGAAAAGRVHLLRPVRRGQLVDLGLAEEMLAEVLRRAGVNRLSRPRVLVGVHVGATPVQRRAMERALARAGARSVRFIELPLAVAVGAGLAIEEPSGSMVVEVGGGTTDIAVLALGGMVTADSVDRGGDDFEMAIRSQLVRHHGLVVDRPTAVEVLRLVGTVQPTGPGSGEDRRTDQRVEVVGRELSTGRPAAAVMRRSEVRQVLVELLGAVLDAAVRCITEAPPDLANDLLSSGLVLAGGGSQLDGLDLRLARATGLPVHVVPNPHLTAAIGAASCLDSLADLPPLAGARRR